MNLRSNFGNVLSWIPLEIDPHEGDPNYFDFVTYFGLVSLSMGTIASLELSAKDKAARDDRSSATSVGNLRHHPSERDEGFRPELVNPGTSRNS
jgi:hypothetical protein